MEAFKISGLTFTYPLMEKPALCDINMTVKEGSFTVICGKSGCGKSTLLRQLKTILSPHGKVSGNILFYGRNLSDIEYRTQAGDIGYVLQNPENQIVTDKVWHELAFGLESLGEDNETIRLRVSEMASFFGIQSWFRKSVTELSGGQKQLLNLASIMAMQPKVLILDEPTSQLDPIATRDFLNTIKRINSELGTTIIMSEHHLEEVFDMADDIVVMSDGRIISEGSPRAVGEYLHKTKSDMFYAMPSAMRIYYGTKEIEGACPINVKEGRQFINNYLGDVRYEDSKKIEHKSRVHKKDDEQNLAVSLKDIWFKYEKDGADVIKGLSMNIKKGEFYTILGGNGTGKTTTLSLISGLNRPYRGSVKINGVDIRKLKDKELFSNNLGVLPQNPQVLFVKKTVELDLMEMLPHKMSTKEKEEAVLKIAEITDISHLLKMHPYDLSGGEQQKAALAKVLLLNPKILILDEPTKGMDTYFKDKFYKILKTLIDDGATIIMVSHDIEFAAKYSDRCALFFDGNITAVEDTRKFFAGNTFYTTAANRIIRHKYREAVTVEDVIELCRKIE